jgi:redox-sensitive bicupin YhaK (pirin superfamily)
MTAPHVVEAVRIIRSADRKSTVLPWLDSRHSFNFNHFYDPDNRGHGLLLVSNDDVVRASSGFATHHHRDMEIVTWVLEGELEHRDSTGNHGIIYPGLAQRMSAGTGIWHSELNPRSDSSVHFVQMWILPDTESVDPSYEQADINTQLVTGALVPVVSGRGHDSAISMHQEDSTLWAARLAQDQAVNIPDAPLVHLFVASGGVALGGGQRLAAGDAARMTGAGSPRLTAYTAGTEVLICESAHTV